MAHCDSLLYYTLELFIPTLVNQITHTHMLAVRKRPARQCRMFCCQFSHASSNSGILHQVSGYMASSDPIKNSRKIHCTHASGTVKVMQLQKTSAMYTTAWQMMLTFGFL